MTHIHFYASRGTMTKQKCIRTRCRNVGVHTTSRRHLILFIRLWRGRTSHRSSTTRLATIVYKHGLMCRSAATFAGVLLFRVPKTFHSVLVVSRGQTSWFGLTIRPNKLHFCLPVSIFIVTTKITGVF